MHVNKLKGPPFEKIQCSLPKEDLNPASLGWKGYREKRSKYNGQEPNHCMRHAKWVVDGVPLCTQHAGMKALHFLCEA